MKRVVILVIVLIGVVLGGTLFFKTSNVEIINHEPQTIEKEVEVETLQKRIDEAVNASSTAIENAAQKAYEDAKAQMLVEIELEVTRAYRAEIEAREATLEEKISL